MGSTINVNYMSNMTSQYAKAFSKRTTSNLSRIGSMADAIKKISSEASTENVGRISKTMETGVISKEDMTMEEYKQYISDQISSFRIDPSRSRDQYSINISDAGFEAMKNDPEYEEWVLDYVKRDMAVAAPWWYTAMGGEPAYCILNFGATKEERTGQMFSTNFKNGQGASIFNFHSDNSFWTNRNNKQKQMKAVLDKKAEERKRQKKIQAENAVKQLDLFPYPTSDKIGTIS